MATTFIFINELNEQGYPCLVLDDNGEILQALETRNFPAIHTLQAADQGKTIIVLPCFQFSLHDVELPLLSDKKVRQALPFALEDNLTQAIEELHFSFDRHYFTKGHYLACVCSQSYFLSVITQLTELSIHFDTITLDWFALKQHESAILTESILIHDESFQGSLDFDLAKSYFKGIKSKQALYRFQDSAKIKLPQKELPLVSIERCDIPQALWLAQRLLEKKPMNLCQGLFALTKNNNRLKLWYYAAAGLFAAWLITLLSINSYQLLNDNHEIKALDSQIATIYRHFFPDAKQIINPRFRITQFLKSSASSSDEGLWILLSKCTKIIHENPMKLSQINWQNHILLVTFAVKDFKALDTLQSRLKQAGLHVKQTQAATKDSQVVSTLELSL